MKEFTIGKNDAGQRLDKYLSKSLPLLPQSLMYKAIRKKKIKVNRARADIRPRKLCEGDTLQLFLPDDLLSDNGEAKAEPYRTITPHIDIIWMRMKRSSLSTKNPEWLYWRRRQRRRRQPYR